MGKARVFTRGPGGCSSAKHAFVSCPSALPAVGARPGPKATRVLRSLFVDIDPVDPATLAFVGLGLGIVVLLASYVPALRATKVDPMVALRHE